MNIVQILPAITYGDGVSNDALQIRKLLEEHGIASHIYADRIGKRVPETVVHSFSDIPEITDRDVIIYHGSTGSWLNERLACLPAGKKIMVYHNITPPAFFHGYSDRIEQNLERGYREMRFLSDKVDACIADSRYNRTQLLNMGYQCPIEVCPILIPFSDYDAEPDPQVMKRCRQDGKVNFLFVGRIAPNKKQEDIIRAFYYYHRYYNANSQLFLVGGFGGFESYYMRLMRYTAKLQLQDSVIFSGHIPFQEILAYYRTADAFVCMSEHEGFCIPLVEAMHFSLPIIAYRSSAVPETLGSGGLCLDTKDGPFAAAAMDRLIRDGAVRKEMLAEQKKILASLSGASETMWNCLNKIITNL